MRMSKRFAVTLAICAGLTVAIYAQQQANAVPVDKGAMTNCAFETKTGDLVWKDSATKETCCNKSTKKCVTCNKTAPSNCTEYDYQPKKNILGNGAKPITKAQ